MILTYVNSSYGSAKCKKLVYTKSPKHNFKIHYGKGSFYFYFILINCTAKFLWKQRMSFLIIKTFIRWRKQPGCKIVWKFLPCKVKTTIKTYYLRFSDRESFRKLHCIFLFYRNLYNDFLETRSIRYCRKDLG